MIFSNFFTYNWLLWCAYTCQAMALSVRHWSASPSGSLTVSFCRLTNRDRIVSSLGCQIIWQIRSSQIKKIIIIIAFRYLPVFYTGNDRNYSTIVITVT